ncbi:MAG: serine acetyltransferase [Candidatus Omnitrophica bacterium]|nr:serine acetyltransferase [Candidatus Omnitrophota bacterium]
MFKNLKADFGRYKAETIKQKVYVLFEQGFWAVAIYRLGQWTATIRIPVVGFILRFAAFLLFKMVEITTGISIPSSAKIGKGFYVGHFGGIVLHSDVVMGENCSIGPGVLIGTRGLGNKGVAVIGNNVYIGVGAKVLGKITIGNDVKIGANAVVVTNLPDGATAVGIPARIISKV